MSEQIIESSDAEQRVRKTAVAHKRGYLPCKSSMPWKICNVSARDRKGQSAALLSLDHPKLSNRFQSLELPPH
jgi:hypothetical protein